MSGLIKTLKLEVPQKMEYAPAYETEKDKRKFIERCKRIIRSSKEYKDYMRFLRENMDFDSCAFFKGVKHTKDNKIQIEIHHEPFTLDDIVRTVINKQLDEGKPLNDLDISDEVMELHYSDMVGLIPLSKTIHEVYHADSNKIFIPLYLCYGNYKKFIEEYQDYIEDDIISRLEVKIDKTKNIKPDAFDALNVGYEYLDVEGVEAPQKMEVASSMAVA